MKQGDYIVIQSEMVSELGLFGNELIVYALIHGFCKDGDHEFNGSINYICEWTNLTKVTVISILKKLVEKNLLEKREYLANNVKLCAYKIGGIKILPLVKNFNRGGIISLPGGGKETLPNNTTIDKTNNKKEGTIVPKKKTNSYSPEFEEDFILYQRKGSKKNAYERWKKLSDEDKEKMRKHIPFYLQSNDRQYLKDFEGYINQRAFESPVYKGSVLLYDPVVDENKTNGVYDATGWMNYDGRFNAWRFFYGEPKYNLHDGYTDDDRPDGARVVNQVTVWQWSADKKEWIKQ